MVHAAIIACPVFGGTVKSVDERPDRGARGILQVSSSGCGGVVADRYFRAKAALESLRSNGKWVRPVQPTSVQFRKDYITALDQTGAVARHDGNVDAAMPGAAKVIEAVYDARSSRMLRWNRSMPPRMCRATASMCGVGRRTPIWRLHLRPRLRE